MMLPSPLPLHHPRWSAFLPGPNDAPSSSFEGGTTGWAFDKTGTQQADTSAPDGRNCCEVAAATTLNDFSSGASTASAPQAATAGEVYDGMIWTKDGAGSEGQDLYIRFRDGGGGTLSTPQMTATGRKRNGWSQHAVLAQTAPVNTADVILLLFNQSNTSALRIDAAQLRRR